ncbi:MAG TPA: hypothetical protein VMV40_01035 [Acidiferrobacter sp.]|nr:hypothetical protein [Acidiferrobacter sp.]
MASIPLTESALTSLKQYLHAKYPEIRSSHLTEAIAAALGCKSHAALQTELSKIQDSQQYVLLDDTTFDKRLQDLGYPSHPEFIFESLNKGVSDIISTVSPSASGIEYRTERERAWRNLMVCTINEGIRQRLFTLHPGNYSWVPQNDESLRQNGCCFHFNLPNGQPASGYVRDARFGELSIHAAANPTGNFIRSFNAGFLVGDAFATGWLEREKGAWLQSTPSRFNCRKSLLKSIANIEVRPRGFGDRGQLII